jgi:hypothetical protein
MLGLWISAYQNDEKVREADLGELVKKMQADSELKLKHIVINAASILARMHARSKPNEEVRHGARSLSESDAECGINLVALLVLELGWAAE